MSSQGYINSDSEMINKSVALNESGYFTDEPVPEYIFESPTGEFFTDQDVKKHLAEMGFEVF